MYNLYVSTIFIKYMYKTYVQVIEMLKFTQKKSEVFYYALVDFIFLHKKKRYKISLFTIN